MFNMRPSAFISYRRHDTIGHVGRLHDRLSAKWGGERIYWDIDNIPPGEDFLSAIDSTLSRCDIVLLIIGPRWLGAADSSGRRRLDVMNDFHRLEIERAIQLDKRIIPILMNNATLPNATDLPQSIQTITRKNAFEISDKRFDYDTAQLIKSIELWFAKVQSMSRADSANESRPSYSERETVEHNPKEYPPTKKTGWTSRPSGEAVREPFSWDLLTKLFVPSNKWLKISPQEAVNHSLYGIRGLMLVFLIFVLCMPIQAVHSFVTAWREHNTLPLTEAFNTESAKYIYMRTDAIINIFVACLIVTMVLLRSNLLRVVGSASLIWGWPLTRLFGLSDGISPQVHTAVSGSFVVWLFACAIWIPYLYKSKRVRVTFENSVRGTDARLQA